MRSDDSPQVGDGVLEVVQVGGVEVLDRGVLHADECDVAVRRDAAGRPEHVRECLESGLHRRQLRRSVLGFEHDVGGDPALVGLGLGEQLRSLVGVEAGRLEAVLELAPEGAEEAMTTSARTTQAPMATQGRVAADRPSR